MHGGIIEAPCINKSFNETIIIGQSIYLGFMFLHAFESKIIKRLLRERLQDGAFLSLDDFIERVPISIEQIAILIKIDAFRFTRINKRELLWEAHLKISKTIVQDCVMTLFRTERIRYETPELPSTTLENAFDALELLGFPLCSPFQLLEKQSTNSCRAKHLIHYQNKVITIEGYLITTKTTLTSNKKPMLFGTFLDRDGDFIDTVHFPPVAAKFPFRGKGVYHITGKVLVEFDCTNIEVISIYKQAVIEDPRYSDMRKAEGYVRK
jgi:DNA polymerase-3 subunit alpha